MNDERRDRGRVIEELIDAHVRFDYDLIAIDDQTWAIHGIIAVDGQVILAEFTTQEDARSALDQLVRAENATITA